VREWLDFIHPDYGTIEARFIQDGSVHRTFSTDRDELARAFKERDESGWDVYIGVLPRRYNSVAGSFGDIWPSATILWADVDAKDFCPDPVLHTPESRLQGSPDFDKTLALDAILQFPVTPSAIIDSGHGYHVYWRLAYAVDTTEAVEANQAIAKWLGADKCFDAPRILRVPGTRNHKEHNSPVPVRVLKLDTLRRYDLSDFTEMIEALHSADRPRYRSSAPDDTVRRQDAPDWLRDAINTEPAKGQRSEEEFRIGLWLSRYGYTDDEVLDVLMNMPIGAKAQERGEQWARAEVARIRRKA